MRAAKLWGVVEDLGVEAKGLAHRACTWALSGKTG